MSVLMQVSGITGESKLGDQQGWISINGFNWGGNRAYGSATGGNYGVSRAFTALQIRDVVVTREADSTSSQLWAQVASQADLTVKIRWLRPESTSSTHFLEVSLTGARVVSIEDVSGGDRPRETVKFSYEEIEFIYFPLGDAVTGSQQVLTYIVPTGQG